MTKDKFVAIQTRRGYEVEDLGRIVIIRMDNYSAMYFFTADGKVDETEKPFWTIRRQARCPKNCTPFQV